MLCEYFTCGLDVRLGKTNKVMYDAIHYQTHVTYTIFCVPVYARVHKVRRSGLVMAIVQHSVVLIVICKLKFGWFELQTLRNGIKASFSTPELSSSKPFNFMHKSASSI